MYALEMLDKWMALSSDNFNIFVGITTAVMVTSVGVMLYCLRKLGKTDERTRVISYKVMTVMFWALLCTNSLFITWVSADMKFFRQYMIAGVALALLAGAIASFYLYRREMK